MAYVIDDYVLRYVGVVYILTVRYRIFTITE
jgi:hypothetical protein